VCPARCVAVQIVMFFVVALFCFIDLSSCHAEMLHGSSRIVVHLGSCVNDHAQPTTCVVVRERYWGSHCTYLCARFWHTSKESRTLPFMMLDHQVKKLIGLTFPPRYWRSYWFRAVCLVMGMIAIFYLFLAKVRLDQRRVRDCLRRASEEREDRAYQISDKLLQGLQAIALSIETANVRANGIEPVREALARSLQQSGALMEEGRARMMNLHRPKDGEDLPNAIAVACSELQRNEQRKYRVIVHGEMRDLRPMIRDDLYKIGREALHNAFRHADANEIEAEFFYKRSEMRIYVRDDGCGISSAALSDRIHGVHCGIVEMHRKARKSGARLEIRSRRNAGTEIELRIPASLAYEVDGSLRSAKM
jgi:signal transduction histidine kinase